jgi:hypothetical protein
MKNTLTLPLLMLAVIGEMAAQPGWSETEVEDAVPRIASGLH